MGALPALQTSIFDLPHLVGIPAPEHLGHEAIVVGGLVAWMGVLKRLPVIGKDLLEDTPVPRRGCHHRVAPSEGNKIVVMQRLYHGLPASSTPPRPAPGYPHSSHLPFEL
jgi:hypothetical protein